MRELKIFVSYATTDSKPFKIDQFVKILETMKPGIQKVFYWERDTRPGMKFDVYMTTNIEQSDYFLLFCSENVKQSCPVWEEIGMAKMAKKEILPIAKAKEDIPNQFQENRGILHYDPSYIKDFITELYDLLTEKKSIPLELYGNVYIFKNERPVLMKIGELLAGKSIAFDPSGKRPTCYNAKDGHIIYLKITSASQILTKLPPFEQLKFLEELILKIDNLKAVPEGLCDLVPLKKLMINNSHIGMLPENIGNLQNLENLDLVLNHLTALPAGIGKLKSLKMLLLDSNELVSLPEEIGELSSLQILHLYNNQLTELPESFANLISLQSLSIPNNRLTTLPESIGRLQSLQSLSIPNNRLTTLPESIGNLKSLKTLELDFNQLTELPESLAQLSNLSELSIMVNPLNAQCEEILNKLKEIAPSVNIRRT